MVGYETIPEVWEQGFSCSVLSDIEPYLEDMHKSFVESIHI